MNRSTRLIAAGLVAVVATLGAAPASAQQKLSDARCFLVSNMFANRANDQKAKEAGGKAYLFYMGRLVGSAAQIEAALVAEIRTVTPQNAGDTMQACAQAAEQKRLQLMEIGKRLSQPKGK